jgi:lauroyl/myristoyl acyltransferase
MNLVKLFTNKHLINFGIKLCQLTPPWLAMPFIEFTSKIISAFKGSDLIRNIRSNQQVVSGMSELTDKELDRKAQAVMRHAMICYYDFFHLLNDLDGMCTKFPKGDQLLAELDALMDGKGALIITPHLSNFNLVFQVITSKGFTTKLLTLTKGYSGYDLMNELRISVGAEIIPVDQGDHSAELVAHLKTGGSVSTGVDRPIQRRKSSHRISFFGRPSDLPAGYISLALAADVPVIILSIHMKGDGIYGHEFIGPIQLEQHSSRRETITKNAEEILKHNETLISRNPDQWLMYHPVWPLTTDEIESNISSEK